MSRPLTELERALIAQACHESNRVYCAAIGDLTQVPWERAADWQVQSAVLGVQGVIDGNSPAQQHQGWSDQKVREGWVYGPVKDPLKKTHPCLVPYDQLPPEQQRKDQLFIDITRAILRALEAL